MRAKVKMCRMYCWKTKGYGCLETIVGIHLDLHYNTGLEQSMKPMIEKSIDQSMTIDAN